MSVASLSQIMPPPPVPIDAVGDWGDVERAIGTNLPNDFKNFIELYGSGTIGRFITVYNPFSFRTEINLIDQSRRQLSALQELREEFTWDRVYSLYPNPGGLFPVAVTDNGDFIYWLTEGIPDEWTIVVNESRGPDYEVFGFSLTFFLKKVIDKSVRCRAFPENLFGNHVEFFPI